MKQLSLSVITFNICLAPFYRKPYKRILEFASCLPNNTDVINLQEVYTYDILWALQNKLKDYSFSFNYGLYGPKSGLVTISRIPIKLDHFTALPKQKGILVSSLANGIVIANVHLVTNTDGDWTPGNRYFSEHKRQLKKLNDELITKPEVILSGDFNLAKSCELYTEFKSHGKWADVHEQDFSPTFHKEFLPADREPQRIDYIFARGNIAPQTNAKIFESKINGQYLSNHVGLTATLQIKSE